jgi:hypothetical protein
VATGTGGTIALGGTPIPRKALPMTFMLPGGAGKSFSVNIPEQCAVLLNPYSTPTVSFSYDSRCEGKTVRAIAYNTTNGSTDARYIDAGAVTNSLEFPALPADLGVPVPTYFDQVDLIKFDIPQATTATIAQSIDQSWRRWPYDATLLPDTGGGLAKAEYLLGAFTGP